MICIRVFKTRQEAEWGKRILTECEMFATVSEDKFNGVPIQKFGVSARFRLKIAGRDLDKAAHVLAEKLRTAATNSRSPI